jgi:hypothetical protein
VAVLNNDTDLDIVVSNLAQSEIILFPAVGDGTFNSVGI